MKGIKQLRFTLLESKYDKIKEGKREDETWEEYIYRKTVTEAKVK